MNVGSGLVFVGEADAVGWGGGMTGEIKGW